jgi:hypothetical protein
LKQFFENYASASINQNNFGINPRNIDERTLVAGLYQFSSLLLELVSFWYVLIEVPTQLPQLFKKLSAEVSSRFEKHLSFRWLLFQHSDTTVVQNGVAKASDKNALPSFLLGPVQTCQPLIHALIKSHLDDGMAVDTLCMRLRQHCPRLFTAEDAVAANALELLQQAHHSMVSEGVSADGTLGYDTTKTISVETEQKLSTAINLLLSVSASINLSAISQTVKACGAHDGLLKICLQAAEARDPHKNAKFASFVHDHVSQKRGIQNSKNSAEKSIDPEVARQAFERRHECYRVAIVSLNVFEIVG